MKKNTKMERLKETIEGTTFGSLSSWRADGLYLDAVGDMKALEQRVEL
jgi:hypothetical protein